MCRDISLCNLRQGSDLGIVHSRAQNAIVVGAKDKGIVVRGVTRVVGASGGFQLEEKRFGILPRLVQAPSPIQSQIEGEKVVNDVHIRVEGLKVSMQSGLVIAIVGELRSSCY